MARKKHPLVAWREAQTPQITQAQFARRIEVARSTINHIEAGRRVPGRDLIMRIGKETGWTVGLNELVAAAPKPMRAASKTEAA